MHLFYDVKDADESYHTLYFKTFVEEAGFKCKIVEDLTTLSFKNGFIVDNEGNQVKIAWKTWSYDTLFSRWKGEQLRTEGDVRLQDVLLNSNVKVFEPLWTAITGNKALYPVLWQLFPNHPNLLCTKWELDDYLIKVGYAQKAINGRGGYNIDLINKEKNKIESISGRFNG